MKSALYWGDGKITIEETERGIVGSHQVRLAIQYVGVCGSDVHIAQGHMDQRIAKSGYPRVFGHEASAIITELGSEVSGWKVGDHVVVYAMRGCGHCALCENDHANICLDVKSIGIDCDGAYRQEWIVDDDLIFATPDNLTDQEAALVEPLAVAVHAVSRSCIAPGETAIVIGGGPIGLMVGMVLKNKGINVTISEINQTRLDNCRKMGLQAINPLEQNAAEYAASLTNGIGVVVVFEASGSKNGIDTAPSLIRPNGMMITVATFSQPIPVTISAFHFKQIVITTTRAYQHKDYVEALRLLSSGEIQGKELISGEVTLDMLPQALSDIVKSPNVIKMLVKCS